MPSLGTLTLNLVAKVGGFTGSLDKAERKSKRTAGQIARDQKRSREEMKKTVAVAKQWGMAMGVAAGAAVAGAVRVGARFQQQMTTVQGVMRATDKEYKKLSDAAKLMGATTEWSATQSAEALQFMGMAGYSVQESISALPGMLKLASAGGLDLARASDIVTDSLTAMGMSVDELSKFNDVLIGTITRSNTNVEMLGESLKYVAPIASQLGYDIEQVAAMLGILANAGIKASDAGTDLRKAMIQNSKAAKQLNTDEKDLIGTLKAAKEAGWGVNEVVKNYGILASKSVLVLMDQIDAYKELENTLQDVSGETDALAAKKLDTLIGDFKILKSAVEGVGIELFESIEKPLRSITKSTATLVSDLSMMFGGGSTAEERLFGKATTADVIKKINLRIIEQQKEYNALTIELVNAKNNQKEFNKVLLERSAISSKIDELKKLKNEYKDVVANIADTGTTPTGAGTTPTSTRRAIVSGPSKEEIGNFKSTIYGIKSYHEEVRKISAEEEKVAQENFKRLMNGVAAYREAKEEEKRIEKEAAEYKKQLLQEEIDARMQAVMAAGDSFAYMAQLAKEYGNDQTALYKTLFAASKAFSIAEATLNMFQAITEAGTLPFPANLGAMAIVGAQMATIISSLMAVGMAHDGIDSVPETGTWLLKKGERVMTSETSAKLDNTLSRVQSGAIPYQGGSGGMVTNNEPHYHYNQNGPTFLSRANMRDAAAMLMDEMEKEQTRRGAVV